MKVYGVFREMMLTYYFTEVLVQLYQYEEYANTHTNTLNLSNTDPMQEDEYGPISGTRYIVKELEVK